MSQRRRALLLTGILSIGMVGCELIADFDRSKIDAGPLPSLDGGPPGDGEAADAPSDAPADTTVGDAGNDVTVNDSGGDTNQPDTNVPDNNVPDTNVPDNNVPDNNVPDTNVPDNNVPDNNVPDTNVPDTNVPDTNVPDTNVPDTNQPDTNPPADAGRCNTVNASTAPMVTETTSTSGLPTFTGGALVDGNYVLTATTTYGAADAGTTSNQWQMILVASQTGTATPIFDIDTIVNTTETDFTGTFVPVVATPGSALFTQSCPAGATPVTVGYTIGSDGDGGTQLLVQYAGNLNTVLTFEKQ
jgi:hypothetical protein